MIIIILSLVLLLFSFLMNIACIQVLQKKEEEEYKALQEYLEERERGIKRDEQ